MPKPYIIAFAGVPGSSKSIIAYYLSETFLLPIFSTDNIRFEVKEDLLVSNINEAGALKEFERRRAKRFQSLLKRKQSLILDGSVDRRWREIKQQLIAAGYRWCLIDMELSRDFMINLYSKTNRMWAIEELDTYLAEHNNFMGEYSSDITVEIKDQLFKERNLVIEAAVRKCLVT
jgi:dephospho-CoA kinase